MVLCSNILLHFSFCTHAPLYSCIVTIRTDKVNVLQAPSAPGNWTLATSTNGTISTYVYNSETATSYSPSPLPFNFSVQEIPGVTDAYQIPDLIDMVCVYQTFENLTLSNVTNTNQIVHLSTNASSNDLPVLQQCPTVSPTHLPTLRPTRSPTVRPSGQPSQVIEFSLILWGHFQKDSLNRVETGP